MQIRHMVESGLYLATHKVICSKHEKLFEQAAWIIANISQEDDKHKVEFQKLGCHYPLIEKIHSSDPVKDFDLLKYTVWSLSSLVKSSKICNSNEFNDYLVIPFVKILLTQNDPEMLSNSLSAIASLMDDRQSSNIVSSGLLTRLQHICQLEYTSIIEPISKILAYISSGNDQFLDAICENNLIDFMYK